MENDNENTKGGSDCQERLVSGSLFRRLREKMRQHLSEKARLKERIRQLEASVAAENRKAADLNRRLLRVVDAYASRERGPNDIVRMCVNVDTRMANLRHGNVVYEEAARQLMESLRQALSSRTLYERALITIGDETCDDSRAEIVERLTDDKWWTARRAQGPMEWKPGQVGFKDFPFA